MCDDWRDGSVLEQHKHMLDTGLRSDCTILVGQEPDTKEFHVHKYNLARSSAVFDTMFYGALREQDVVRMSDVTAPAFQAFLSHVYCDTLEVADVKMAVAVCSAAHKYLMQPLVDKCTQYITEHMTPEIVCRVLEFSNLTDNAKLKQHCIDMLQTHTDEVLKADSWCDVDVSVIITLLQQDTLNVESELTLVFACQRWAQHQLGINHQKDDTSQHKDTSQQDDFNQDVKLRQMLSPLLPYLRILTLTHKQFLQATRTCSMFSKKVELLILKCLLEPEEYNLPDGMCQISNARNKPDTGENVDEIKEHLETQPMKTTDFSSRGHRFSPSTEVPITIYKDIVVYGFTYNTLQFYFLDHVTRASLYNKVRGYDEDLTVQFFNAQTGRCVAEYKYKGKLRYDTDVNVEFPQPFLAETFVPHSLKFEFHHQHTDRKYQLFCKNTKGNQHGEYVPDNYEIVDTNDYSALRFPCISRLSYKVI